MKITTRFRKWFRLLRRKQAFKKYKAELREFVYLDEVSVYSLIASRLGPIAAEFTKTETTSLQGEILGSLGVNSGIAEGGISSRVLKAQTYGSQVLRKSIVQTQFKELYELELESLIVRPIAKNNKAPVVRDIGFLETYVGDDWVINPANLTRGQLLEVEVQLEAETIFRISAVISAILEILEENPDLFGVNFYENIIQVKAIDRLLEKLLVGLVPIRGFVIDYRVVEREGQQWIVHNEILKQISMTDSYLVYPLYIVGVAEQSLFWKDIRRILFSKACFRVLCRLTQDNIQTSWMPVKLVQVLETVAPDLAEQIDRLGDGAIALMAQEKIAYAKSKQGRMIVDSLNRYAVLIAEHYEYKITEQDKQEIDLISNQHSISFKSQDERRNAFDAVAKIMIDRMAIERDSSLFAEYREKALTDSGLDFRGMPIAVKESDTNNPVEHPNDRFVDTEFVAIYW